MGKELNVEIKFEAKQRHKVIIEECMGEEKYYCALTDDQLELLIYLNDNLGYDIEYVHFDDVDFEII